MFDPKSIPMLAGLNKLEMDDLLTYSVGRSIPKGTVVFKEGDEADAFYILLEGEVEFTKSGSNGKEERIAILQPPAVFGETVLFLNPMTRIATARTTVDIEVLAFDVKTFMKRLEKGAVGAYKVIHYLAKVIAHRLKAVDEELVRRIGTAAATDRKPLEEFSKFKDKLFAEWNF